MEAASYRSDESTKGKEMGKSQPKGMSVVVLKSEDVTMKGTTVFFPINIEMAKIKKPHTGQFKTGVQISSAMSAAEVEKELKNNFPILVGDKTQTLSFYCASRKLKEVDKLFFHGVPRVWDGKFIKRTIQGNSTLYILMEEPLRLVIFSLTLMITSMCDSEMMLDASHSYRSKGYYLLKVPGTSQIKSQVMEHSTPGNPQMNSTSDPSVVDDQTVNLRDPVTMADEHMCLVSQGLENVDDGVEAMSTPQPESTTVMNTEDEPLHTPGPFSDEVPSTSQIKSQVMEHSTPGNPQMNNTSDPSVVDDQTVNLRDPLTLAPVFDEHMSRVLQELENLSRMDATNTSQPVSTAMNKEDEPLHTAVPSNDEMETFGASKKRKADPDESPEEKLCKKWRSGSDTVQFLKKHSKMEFQCQREELEAMKYGLLLIIEQQKQQKQQEMISMLQQQNQQLQQQNQQLRQQNQQLRQENQQQMQQQLEQMQTELMETRKSMTTLLQKFSEQK
ncbi:golgin subfamily A member 6-like protein 7 isoform X2 [Pocillopora damicornis]|nr:golgin subfamily A member 6-like protein 7 isoform X2 [Pocillopora damicornis]